MLKKILGVFAVLIIVLVVVVSMQPTDYRVERSLSMKAPAATVLATVSDFNTFAAWSPWSKIDPAMKKEIKGVGMGSTYYWNGNDEVGEGRLTVTALTEPTSVDMDLDFIRPFESKAKTGFKIAVEGEGSKVTWWMSGQNNFMAKAAGLMMNMEEMIGNDYNKGLAALKPIVEAKAVADAKAAEEAKALAEAAAAPEGAEGAAEAEGKEATP